MECKAALFMYVANVYGLEADKLQEIHLRRDQATGIFTPEEAAKKLAERNSQQAYDGAMEQ